MKPSIFLYIAVMAGVTYAVRMIPFTVFRKKIKSRIVCDFLYYMPYAVLGAMTFPAVLYSTGSFVTAASGTAAAMVFAFKGKSLIVVAIAACVTALIVGFVLSIFNLGV